MLKVLGRKTSGNVQKVLWLLEELKTPYEREDYGRQFNNTQTEAYLKLNPNARVPTLIDGDTVIWESNTILRYLAAKAGNKFYSADLAKRTQIERWMDWQLASLNPPYLAVFRESKSAPEQRSAEFATNAKALVAELKILDGALASNEWIAGAELTIADMALASIVHRCLAFPIELPELKNVRRWHAQYAGMEGFKTAIA